MRTWDVQYEVRSGVDNHETVMSSGTVTVSAVDAAQAQRAAVDAVYDTDAAADERLDPRVTVRDATEVD